MWKWRIELLPLLNSPPSARFGLGPAARATWGDVCSLARRISSFKNWGACMKPDLSFLSVGGVVWCPVFVCPSSCDHVCTGIHGTPRIFWDFMALHGVFRASPTQQIVDKITILGNNVTNESVIRSELLVDEGDPLTETKLSKSITKCQARIYPYIH